MTNEWYVIKNLEKFIDSTRVLVFHNFMKQETEQSYVSLEVSQEEKEELDKILGYEESSSIINSLIKKQIHKKSKKTRYLLNDNLFIEIVESLNNRMISNVLNSLVNKGLVETAFDTDSNDFIFWVKDENKEQYKKNIKNPEAD